jgi:acyl-homoserine-lactone acylase
MSRMRRASRAGERPAACSSSGKPGWKRDALPVDRVPFAALPQVESPPSGFLQNCNVAANAVTPGLLFRAEDFPPGTLWGHYGAYRARGQRATELLAAARNLDAARATEIVFDTYCPPADLWIPILVAAAEEEAARRPGDAADMAGAARRLRAWNRHVSADSTGATLFRFWRLACEALPGSRAGRDDFAIGDTPELRRDCVTVLRAALEELRRRYGRPGTPEIPWGEIKRLRRGDREWPLSGDGLERLGLDTLRATAAATFDDRGRLIATGGQSHIGLVFLGEVPQIHAVVAYGQSNNPSSPHYADQAPLYAGHRLRPVPWTHEAVLGEATARREVRSPSPARRRQ